MANQLYYKFKLSIAKEAEFGKQAEHGKTS